MQGRDTERVLQRICAADVAIEPGGIEADVTVTRLDVDRFLVLSAPHTVLRDADWLRKHIGPDDFATVTDVGGTMAMLAVMGPDSRRLLQTLTDADLANEAFPFGTSREIDLGLRHVRATRITYVGELGWELLIPADLAVHIYDTITEAGTQFGLRHAGYHALNSLRMEKAYRSWGHDISAWDSPLQAGLSFAVGWDKPGGFIGSAALLRQRQDGISRRLVQFALDDPDKIAYHEEPIYRDGDLVGRVASAMYGHTLGRCVALGYVTAPENGTERSWFEAGCYEIEIATQRCPARASLRPMYDPKSERPKSRHSVDPAPRPLPEQIVTSLDLDATVHVALAGDDPAAEPADDAATANRVAETLLAAWCANRTHVYLDTFADVDRGYFPRLGITDRHFNPRLAGTVYRNLHAALRQIGPARWDGDAVDLPGARVCRVTGRTDGILVLPTAKLHGSELTAVTGPVTVDLVDLATGAVCEGVDLTTVTCSTPVFLKQVAPERS